MTIHISTKRHEYPERIFTNNYTVLHALQIMLLNLGINSSIKSKHTLVIYRDSSLAFIRAIGLEDKDNYDYLTSYYKPLSPHNYMHSYKDIATVDKDTLLVRVAKVEQVPDQAFYDVETISVLPPLPAGWKDSLEDLQYQATPTSEYAPNYVAKIITTINSAIGVKQPAPKLNNNAGTTAYAHMQTAPTTPEAPNTAGNVSTTPINAPANVNSFGNVQKSVQGPVPSEPAQQASPFAIPAVKTEQEEDATADSFASSEVDTPMAGKAADDVKDDDQPEQTLPDTHASDAQASNGVQTPDDILNAMPDYLKDGLEGIK